MLQNCSPIVERTPSGFRDERLDELLSCFRFGVSCLDPFVLDKRRSKVGQCRFSMTGVPAEFFDSFLMSHDFILRVSFQHVFSHIHAKRELHFVQFLDQFRE